jgi:hypothetical protein
MLPACDYLAAVVSNPVRRDRTNVVDLRQPAARRGETDKANQSPPAVLTRLDLPESLNKLAVC